MHQTQNTFVIHCMSMLVLHWKHLAALIWKTAARQITVKYFNLLVRLVQKQSFTEGAKVFSYLIRLKDKYFVCCDCD